MEGQEFVNRLGSAVTEPYNENADALSTRLSNDRKRLERSNSRRERHRSQTALRSPS
jgi:hypothetical protein